MSSGANTGADKRRYKTLGYKRVLRSLEILKNPTCTSWGNGHRTPGLPFKERAPPNEKEPGELETFKSLQGTAPYLHQPTSKSTAVIGVAHEVDGPPLKSQCLLSKVESPDVPWQ